ncbi:hypothetical protein GCM10023335_25590 [Streptomyces siamensis]|uniref:Transposase n=1 Tax=Streptomyces siamensis TaxID=1274986 RepID=A0ABP9IT47_9ACTN
MPVYLVADPYQGKCHLFTRPKAGDYLTETTVVFGGDVDMTNTLVGLVLKTGEFPRD